MVYNASASSNTHIYIAVLTQYGGWHQKQAGANTDNLTTFKRRGTIPTYITYILITDLEIFHLGEPSLLVVFNHVLILWSIDIVANNR